MFVQHMIFYFEKWTGMLKAMPVHLPGMKVLTVHFSEKNIYSSACAVVIKIMKIKIDKCKDFQLSVDSSFFSAVSLILITGC